MTFEHNFNLGDILENDSFSNYYVKLIKEKNDKSYFKVYSLVDGVEQEEKFTASLELRNHKLEFDDFNVFYEFTNCQIDFNEICLRADSCNKQIIGYAGIKAKTKYWNIRCLDCNTESVQRNNLFSRCKFCADKDKVNNLEDFKKKSYIVHGNKYCYDSVDYIDTKSKIKILCNTCLCYFYQRVNSHLSGKGCPKCRRSKGEIFIESLLDSRGVNYISQKSFDGLVYKGSLRYDFYLEDYNLLIEYDGKQHFGPVNFCNDMNRAIEDYKLVQLRDEMKNKWALKNNIPLLRIPYWDFRRIEELIDAFILKHSKREVKQLVLDM